MEERNPVPEVPAVPALGVLYESSEWSDFKFAMELCARDVPVRMIDMERPDAVEVALARTMLTSRVPASAVARGHVQSHAHMLELIEVAEAAGIPMVNTGSAFRYEISKQRGVQTLGDAGFCVPKVYACAPAGEIDVRALAYPCIIKPDCGGRSARTAVLRDDAEARAFLVAAPQDTTFIVEEFLVARAGYVTRIEIVGGACAHIQKRSIAACGLSSYHVGSTYEAYDDTCPQEVRDVAERAAALLGFELGSFDVIETERAPYIIDTNAMTNVSADCEELLGFDLMAEHAAYVAARWFEHVGKLR